MRKMKKISAGLFAMMMAIAMITPLPAVNVEAASKKLSVNRVYEQSTRIKGKTKKRYTVKVKIGGKTYQAKANKKGRFSIKVPKVKVGKKYTVRAYKGRKYYAKKTVYVIARKVKVNSYKPTSKAITGYTRPSYKVKIGVSGKTYTVKAGKSSGYFKVKLKKAAGSSKIAVKVYNTKGKSFASIAKTHTHDWKKQYKTVHHDEVGHYETVTVPAWDETKYENHWICYGCGKDLDVEYEQYKAGWEEHLKEYPDDTFAETLEEFCTDHRYILETDCTSSWYSKPVPITVHHDATTKQEWKVDKKAYDEKVANGYKCACGAVK